MPNIQRHIWAQSAFQLNKKISNECRYKGDLKNECIALLTKSEADFRKKKPNQGQTVCHRMGQNKISYKLSQH